MTNLYKKIALVFTTISLFTFVAISQTTVTYMISDANDDVEEYVGAYTSTSGSVSPDGYMDNGSSDLELCTQNANNKQMIGCIWRGVAIPAGATITNAFVQFTCDDDDNQEGPLPVTIGGIKEVNTSAPFTDVLFNVTSRPKTTATVAWSIPVWAVKEERGALEQTPDIKTIIQEIVNQPGWASGNNLGVVFYNNEMANIHREAAAYEDNVLEAVPGLSVTFTAVGVSDVVGSSVSMYPNPSTGRVTIKNPSTGKFGYAIYNVIGKVVKTRDDIAGSSAEVDMSSSAKGTYFVEVKSDAKTFKSKLILK